MSMLRGNNNPFGVSMVDPKDELKKGFASGNSIEAAKGAAIDNSPTMGQKILNTVITKGAEAFGTAMGGPLAGKALGTLAQSSMGGSDNKMTPPASPNGPVGMPAPLTNKTDTSNMMASYNPTGMEMNNRIYDDWIIEDFIRDGVVLDEEVKDIGRDGYKQIVPLNVWEGGYS